MENINNKITSWFNDNNIEIPNIKANLISDGIIDSFQFLNLIMFCENEFNVKFLDKHLQNENFANVNTLSYLINDLLLNEK